MVATRESLPASTLPSRVTLLLPDPHARFVANDVAGTHYANSQEGFAACTYVLAWSSGRAEIPDPVLEQYFGQYADFIWRPDERSMVTDGDRAYVVCDVKTRFGETVPVAPRSILAKVLDRAAACGVIPSVGLEHEVTFYDADGKPATAGASDYALHVSPAAARMVEDLWQKAQAWGLTVESARAECFPGQYEMVLKHRPAMAAADDAMLLQMLVRQNAVNHGFRASYLAAEHPGHGSSAHVHLSINDPAGSNLGRATGADRGPNPLMASFISGIAHAAADLAPLWAPTPNSYVRLRTAQFSPSQVQWGHDDRSSSMRFIDSGAATRLECRFPGADSQAHLAVAGLIAAGIYGIEHNLAPVPPRAPVGCVPLDLASAVTRWSQSELVSELFGQTVVDHYAAIWRYEAERSLSQVTDDHMLVESWRQ